LRTKSRSKFPSDCKEQKNSISFVITASTVVQKDTQIIIIIIIIIIVVVAAAAAAALFLRELTGLQRAYLLKT